MIILNTLIAQESALTTSKFLSNKFNLIHLTKYPWFLKSRHVRLWSDKSGQVGHVLRILDKSIGIQRVVTVCGSDMSSFGQTSLARSHMFCEYRTSPSDKLGRICDALVGFVWQHVSLNQITNLFSRVLKSIKLCRFVWPLGILRGVPYPKFSPKTWRNNLLKLKHCSTR
jgi:hypothetical protein